MSDTDVDEKAHVYVRDGRLRVISATPASVIADVVGYSGSYRVTWDHDGIVCMCPAKDRCSHQLALQLVTDGPDATQPPESGLAVPDTDAERGVGSDDAKARALAPLADAPVTYQTLRLVADTEFVPRELRGRPAAILAAVLYGRELGLGPMESLAHIDLIEGRPSPSAELLNRLVRHHGHSLVQVAGSDEEVTVRGKRGDNGDELEVTFTMGDAERARLVRSGSAWEKYPQDMLWARAVSRLCRRLFPDVADPTTIDEAGVG